MRPSLIIGFPHGQEISTRNMRISIPSANIRRYLGILKGQTQAMGQREDIDIHQHLGVTTGILRECHFSPALGA